MSKISKKRRDATGEVFTPSELTCSMLSQLPDELFAPEKRWLEPSAGDGNMVIEILKAKMNHGCSAVQALQNLFICEYMLDNVEPMKNRIRDLLGNTKKINELINNNVAYCNTIDEKDTTDGRCYPEFLKNNLFTQNTFDVVFANPPYQKLTADTKQRDELWPKFVDLAFSLIVPNGYVCMITPRSWAAGSRSSTKEYFKQFNPIWINMSVESHFPGIGASISAWIIQKTHNRGKTNFVGVDGVKFKVNVSQYPFIPHEFTKSSIKLFENCVVNYNNKMKFIGGSAYTRQQPRILFFVARFGDYLKSIKSDLTGLEKDISKWSIVCFDVDPKWKNKIVQHNMELPLFQRLYELMGGNKGMSKTWLMSAMPMIDHAKEWTESDLNKYFNI